MTVQSCGQKASKLLPETIQTPKIRQSQKKSGKYLAALPSCNYLICSDLRLEPTMGVEPMTCRLRIG
jgi:hypothetical protein